MIKKFDNIKEHMKGRTKTIGSSEIASILGLNKYQTPYQLWLLKTGRAEKFKGNIYTKAGHYLEPIISKMFEEETGRIIEEGSDQITIKYHESKPFSASPDRYYEDDGRCILECKSTLNDIDKNDIPLTWFSQLQWQLGLCQIEKGSLAWLSKGVFFDHLDIEFNENYFEYMTEEAERFWVDYVLADVEPPMINSNDVIERYPHHLIGKSIEASDDLAEVIDQLQKIKEEEKILKESKDVLKEKVILALKDAESITYKGNVLVTWKSSKASNRFDANTFKSEHPELYNQYTKEVAGSRRFLVK